MRLLLAILVFLHASVIVASEAIGLADNIRDILSAVAGAESKNDVIAERVMLSLPSDLNPSYVLDLDATGDITIGNCLADTAESEDYNRGIGVEGLRALANITQMRTNAGCGQRVEETTATKVLDAFLSLVVLRKMVGCVVSMMKPSEKEEHEKPRRPHVTYLNKEGCVDVFDGSPYNLSDANVFGTTRRGQTCALSSLYLRLLAARVCCTFNRHQCTLNARMSDQITEGLKAYGYSQTTDRYGHNRWVLNASLVAADSPELPSAQPPFVDPECE